ncbi:MAG: hypothetical protein LUD07_01830 [Clostridiales bacterium]|nr:hypothetical protein [Clostridiales bacterium]
MLKIKIAKRIALFTMVGILLFGGCSFILIPIWLDWNNYSTFQGFYKESENTIETVFLGPSSIVSAIIPAELYEDYGICSYNLGSEMQPMLASYY